GAPLPGISGRYQPLPIPCRSDAGLVYQSRSDHPTVRQLETVSRPLAILRTTWNLSRIGAREAEREPQLEVVVQVTEIHALLIVDVVVNTIEILAPVVRLEGLVDRVQTCTRTEGCRLL